MTYRPTPAAGRHSECIQRHDCTRARCSADVVFHVLVLLTCLTFAVLAVGCDARDERSADAIDDPPGGPPPGDDPAPGGNTAVITSIVPELASAAGGTLVTVVTEGFDGDFLLDVPAVSFAGVASPDVVAVDSTTLEAEVPALVMGDVDVQVVTPAMTAEASGFTTVAPAAAGEVLVNEALLNPGGLDASRDGAASNLDDEFVELVNARPTPVDLSGFTLSDASALRHTFANPTTLPAGGALVVFGAGNVAAASPAFAAAHASGHAVSASTGGLSLNNGGDTLTLAAPSSSIVDAVTLGAAVAGVSANRNPDGGAGAPPALHTAVPGNAADAVSGGAFSPGLRADQSAW